MDWCLRSYDQKCFMHFERRKISLKGAFSPYIPETPKIELRLRKGPPASPGASSTPHMLLLSLWSTIAALIDRLSAGKVGMRSHRANSLVKVNPIFAPSLVSALQPSSKVLQGPAVSTSLGRDRDRAPSDRSHTPCNISVDTPAAWEKRASREEMQMWS